MKNDLNTNLGVEIINSKRQVKRKLGQVVRVILTCARPLLLIIGSQFNFYLLITSHLIFHVQLVVRFQSKKDSYETSHFQ